MSYAARIRQATNTATAIVILAEGIDRLLEVVLANTVERIPDDGWGALVPAPGVIDAVVAVTRGAAKQDTSVQAIHDAIAAATDPEDIAALQARLRLVSDPGTTPDAVPGALVSEQDGMVELPAPDPERAAARAKWAMQISLGDMLDPVMDNEQAARMYGRGGPMWLYLPYRECVMGLPEEWRRMMVEDVARDSEFQAQELARDILKDAEPNQPDTTIETMANQAKLSG